MLKSQHPGVLSVLLVGCFKDSTSNSLGSKDERDASPPATMFSSAICSLHSFLPVKSILSC